ncbi:MAG: hypothetical protein ABI838_08565 [Chloroflexota bacterium]
MQTVNTFRSGVSTRAAAAALFLLAALAAVLVVGALMSARAGSAPAGRASLVQQIQSHQASERNDGGTPGASVQQIHDHAGGELTE